MIILVTGKGKSGKSAFAEKLIMEIKQDEPIYYLATMECQDQASRERIEKHRKARADKPFITIEKTVHISDVMFDVTGTVLLECLINLVGNEMFSADGFVARQGIQWSEMILSDSVNESVQTKLVESDSLKNTLQAELIEYLYQEIITLSKRCKNLVIISGDVAKDGESYDAETLAYLDTIQKITKRVADIADKTYEIVEGKAI